MTKRAPKKKKRWRVTSLVRLAIVTEVEADSAEEALGIAQGRTIGQVVNLQSGTDIDTEFVVSQDPTWDDLVEDSTTVEAVRS